ncbi:ArpU family phage packaging/lysis transcriptional regulator [Rossellomorea aquimaris]|uniref:ArpU family transcriptional regulator n=1 Tax=Rossellomorea aquimaris TaxID=189382 RepID=A0A5D4UHQ3_9BACI|nr:ArpU family phage packaging/lysis transcriptional regulator [Rossellomorea aquimaris]TYS77602.1 ArpU family transcriptional regulator [Rossellomorea aquimaris]TYS86783.1 ArpU family transcriptional regulator [Rossellomorea aquimaris]
MNKQLFMLPEIDRKKTKAAVESAFEKYRFYLLMVPEDKLPKVTATYSIVPPSFSNEFYSSTEQAAIKRIELEMERENYIKWLVRGINRLNKLEREIIFKRYLEDEEVFDYEIYNEIGMSERRYYRLKARVFYKLAFILKIEIYKELSY